MSRSRIITFVIVLAALGVGVYLVFFAPGSAPAGGIATSTPLFPTSRDVSLPGGEARAPGRLPGAFGAGEAVEEVTPAPAVLPIRQLVSTPSTGLAVFARGGKTMVRYVDRATGHVYELAPDERVPAKIANTTIPRTHDVLWNGDGTRLVLRSFDSVRNQIVNLLAEIRTGTSSASVAGELVGATLPVATREIAASPDGASLFLLSDFGEGVVGVTSDFANKKKKQIFDHPFGDWLTAWPAPNTITLLTRPAHDHTGFLYTLDTTSGAMKKLLGGVNGLTTQMSPDGKAILYSESTATGFRTYYLDLLAKTFSVFPVQTLPEKCLWGRADKRMIYCAVPSVVFPATYPDDWYQGRIHFSDQIWRINTETFEAIVFADSSNQSGIAPVDAVSLRASADDATLAFQNKNDNSIWTLQLK